LNRIIELLDVKSTLIVDSGSGYHVYFELEEKIKAKYLYSLIENCW